MDHPLHPFLQRILATVEEHCPGRRLDTLLMAYATRARLASSEGFDESCNRYGIRLVCDPWVPEPLPYRLFPYCEGEFIGKVIDLTFPKERQESRLTIRRRHLSLIDSN